MKVIIIGAGTMAKSIANILEENKEHSIIGFLGTDKEFRDYKNKNIFKSYNLIGDKSLLVKLGEENNIGFIVAIGNPKIRENVFSKAIASHLFPIKVISKNAIIAETAKIADGSIISHGVIIGHNVVIGENTIVGSGSIVEINSNIGPNCTIESSVLINGENTIKKNVILRTRSCIDSYVSVGKNQDIEENTFLKKDLTDILKSSS